MAGRPVALPAGIRRSRQQHNPILCSRRYLHAVLRCIRISGRVVEPGFQRIHILRAAQAVAGEFQHVELVTAVGEENREAFLTDYTRRIKAAYPPMADGRLLLRFPRLFVVAVKK